MILIGNEEGSDKLGEHITITINRDIPIIEEIDDDAFSVISFEAESSSLKVSSVEAAKHGEAYYFKIHFAGQTADEVYLFPAGLRASDADKQGIEGIYFEGPFQGEAVIVASSDYIFKNPINTKKMIIRFYNGKEGNKIAQLIINTALLEKL